MPEPVVVDTSGKPAPPSPAVEAIERSNIRMSGFLKGVQKRATNGEPITTPIPVESKTESKVDTKPSGASSPTKEETSGVPSKEQAKPDEKKVATSEQPGKVKSEPKAAEPKAQSIDWYKAELSKFQGETDKAKERVKEFDGKKAIADDEYKTLLDAKTKVDGFLADPTGFMLKYAPDLAGQLAAAGDPIKMIEMEVGQYKADLDTQMKKQFGEDWQFSESEALQPGTPSFRYKIALEDRVADVRGKHRQYVEKRAEKLRSAEASKQADVDKLKSEFGFVDDDIKRADEAMNKMGTSYYNLVRLALLDEIIQKKLSAITPSPTPAPDLSQAPSSREVKPEDKTVHVSDEGKQMLARLGPRRMVGTV